MRRLSVSSWSLHRHLGKPAFYGVENGNTVPTTGFNQGRLSLIELPKAIAAFGIHNLEICHFHLPSRDTSYLEDLRAALTEANVSLFSLLIDDGDITHPYNGQRDLAWIESWFPVAATLGAERTRVIAGKQANTPESLQLSYERLAYLAKQATTLDLRVMTENWFSLLSNPAAVTGLLERLEGQVGLCLDFGNWRGETKYQDLAAIAPYAESCHSKAQFHEGQLQHKDYETCLEITKQAGFDGPYTLIFDSDEPDEWEGLAIEKALVAGYL